MNLKAKMIVDIIRMRLEQKGIQVYIEHTGDCDAGAIFINHDIGEGSYDVYHRINDIDNKKKIKFLYSFTETQLKKFFKKQIEVDSDVWIIEVVSNKIDLIDFLNDQGL